ncbi:MAG: acyltransferase, partial [Arenimonas sp.]
MTRRHDIDALRAIAFAVLILYHLSMLYVSEWEWHIKSSYLAEWLQWPMLFTNRWRMDLIFLISGMAAA